MYIRTFLILLVVFAFFLSGCSSLAPVKPDVLAEMKKEDLLKASKPIPRKFPADIPIYENVIKIKDSAELEGTGDNGKKYINPIAWFEVESIEEIDKAKAFYRLALSKTRYKNILEREVGGAGINNTEFLITLSKTERLKLNFISNFLGSPVIRIEYYNQF